ncbi:AsnC family transcriptional regulator [Vulcanibacillus modesticaldus]|uniref:siroheme decarboxylase n=1 Tax=Vulcanibacillus modesticaldus TaxID=337097 RepID=A0A1D2YSU9_9BACI|nr:AsnC family transcriptional regulator [Vulcanibacillus modesticaldus]OEF98070.1 AsnC family transcriptional regulator [Vulcanibacillus modesticaldus]
MSILQMDKINQELLNLIQKDFPLVERPFLEIANRLNISEAEVINRIKELKGNVIRQISAIFDTKSLGYKSSLVAAKVNPESIDKAAEIVNQHPGVSHNYKRNHEFNLWFTIAVPPNSRLGLEKTVEILGKLAGVESIRLLPTLKLFKIGVQLDMTGKDTKRKVESQFYNEKKREESSIQLTDKEIAIIRVLQKDLAIISRPFSDLANEAGVTVQELLDKANAFKQRGIMRRFAAVLSHRKAGFKANGMGVWKVPKEKQEEIGAKMAAYQAVSHCYLRPTYPDWPYNIFTMVHGRSVEEVEDIFRMIEEDTGITERFVLYSTKEYKKTRVQYFTPEVERWEEQFLKKE